MELGRHALCGLMLVGIAGCGRACTHERPYTPYKIEGSAGLAPTSPAPVASVSAPATSPDAEAPKGFTHVAAKKPPSADASKWDLDGLALAAAAGQRFVLGLAADLDGDGARDAVAWIVGSDPSAGTLAFYKGDASAKLAAPRELASLAGLLPAGCVAEPALEQIGSHTVLVTATAACVERPPPGAKTRWAAALSFAGEPSVREELRIADPPSGERLGLEVDGSDRDGDGRDDLLVRLSLEGGASPFEAGPKVSADLRWFDRPAGLSRDPDEPEASLRAASAWQLLRAQKKSEAPTVPLATRQIARLYAALCTDSGEPLVSFSTGALRCGTSRALEDAVLADVRAAITQGDVLRAIGASDRAAFWPAASSPRRAEIDKALLKATTVVNASRSPPIATVPVPERPGPGSWGPLAFEAAGTLLVRGSDAVVRVKPGTGEEAPADGLAPWPVDVTSPDGASRLGSVTDPCNRLALELHLPGDPVRDVQIPVLAPGRGRCPGAPSFDVVPLAWAASGLEVLVAGEPVLVPPAASAGKRLPTGASLGQPVHPGSPRSPDGVSLAVATRLGVLVRAPSAWQLWRPDGETATDLSACTAANDARAVACVRGGRAFVMLAPAR